ncbi:MAG TPA: sugar ABC transporter substrate-binding protein [Firmicutes bacterium]|nr:sugar ABC transporter substrate-binding protein [Bacillota bacterium]
MSKSERFVFRMVVALTVVMLGALTTSIAAKEVVTLDFIWTGNANWGREMVARFEAENPDIKINYETMGWKGLSNVLPVRIAGGVAPDVFRVVTEQATSFVAQGWLMPLDEKLGNGSFKAQDYHDVAISMWQVDGKLYGLPIGVNALTLYYNRDHYDEMGLQYPDLSNWTWDVFLDNARKLTRYTSASSQPERWGYAQHGNSPWAISPVLFQNGGSILTPDWKQSNIQSPESVEALQWYADLFLKHQVGPKSGNSRTMFINGQLSMRAGGQGDVAFYPEGMNHDVTYLPAGKAGFATAIGGDCISIYPYTKHPEEAQRFAEFLASKFGQELLISVGTVPTLKGAVTWPAFA